MSWAAGHRKVKQNSGPKQQYSTHWHFPCATVWNKSIETFFTFFLSSANKCFSFLSHICFLMLLNAQSNIVIRIDWWPVLKLDFQELNQPSEDHPIKVTFLLSVVTFRRRLIYRIAIFENIFWNLGSSDSKFLLV